MSLGVSICNRVKRITTLITSDAPNSDNAPTDNRILVDRPNAMVARPNTARAPNSIGPRSEEHTSELQSLMRISYAVFCLKKKKYPTRIKLPQVSNTNDN